MEKLEFGSNGKFVDEKMARELLERVRWPDGPICPHCAVMGGHYRVKARKGSRSPVREGVWKCSDCRKQFTVTVGTVFHGSKMPLSKWLMAIYLMGDSRKRVNAHELHRRVGVTYKSARFLVRRLGKGTRQGGLGRKLNSLLEMEGANVVGKRPRRRRLLSKKGIGLLSVLEGKVVSGGSGFLERVMSINLKGFVMRTWRRFSEV